MFRDQSSRANLQIIYTVEQLKCWLKCRRLKQAGKREDLLGAHVNDCLKSGNHHILDPGTVEPRLSGLFLWSRFFHEY